MDRKRLASEEEPINSALRQHVGAIGDWTHAEVIHTYHTWAKRFDSEFALGLETPAIRLDRIRVRALGQYRRGRNGLGLRHELTLNTRYVGTQALAQQLETLLHEILHLWQALHGTPGKHNWHNREFREKARSLGIVIDERGRHTGIERGPFTELLERHGVDTAPLFERTEARTAAATPENQQEGSKLRKFCCGCTNVRCAVDLRARCLKCGSEFKPASASW